MAARPVAPAPNVEQFEVYFQRADLNKDGKISGEEAVAFFQGSNLPKNVLAQIWMHSDKNNTGFLGRPEFYNALRLVTVAQSGRELSREIVKAALEGPAAAKIPPPKINAASTTTPPVNPMIAPKPQMNITMPSSSQVTLPPTAAQNLGFQGPNISTNNQAFPSLTNQLVRSPSLQSTPALSSVTMEPLSQGLSRGVVPGPQLSSASTLHLTTDGFDVRTNAKSGLSQISNKEAPSSMPHDGFPQTLSGPTSLSTQQSQVAPVVNSMLSQSLNLSVTLPSQSDSKALAISGNGFLSESTFGGGVFSATQPNQDASSFTFPTTKMANSSSSGSLTAGSQLLDKPLKVQASNSLSSMVIGGNPLEQTQSLVNHSQLNVFPKTRTPASSTGSGGMGAVGSSLPQSEVSQVPWPKMTLSNIQKYTKVFVEVDKDRDGKITGEEARNLFLSWRLPREVLKQVWDLSDQDGDSMLSLREFCFSLYLMERYREGHPLPAVLPNSLRFDDALLQATSQPSMPYSNVAWQSNTGFAHQALPVSHPVMPAPVVRPQQNIQMQPTQQKSAVPALDMHLVNQEQNSQNSKLKAVDADEKVQELEKEIMDSKEKIEFYRTKMQDLVLYKSRCDNRLNEITEKASSDKREAESLAKKYEEKYKQVADVASKLTVEEATFREIQERKLELYNAIVKMEQGGSADGLLQVRADRIQYDLEELVKALNDRCKKYGLRTKPTAYLELPFGWEPGIPEGAADWDEDWDKFEDDGFMLVKELTADVGNVKAPPKVTASHASSGKASKDDTVLAPTSAAEKVEKYSSMDDHEIKSELADASEDVPVRSPPSSPPVKNSFESPSKGSHPTEFGLNDNHSDYGAAESIFGDNKIADETSWGATFDTNDDVDSIWGFNTFDKETDHQSKQNSFDAGHFGLNPIRTGSPSASSVFGKTRSPFFDESVPATPFSSGGHSPRYGDGLDHSFGSFSRFDSFSSQDQRNLASFDSMSSSNRDFDSSGLFSQPETLARFDSIRSTRETDQSRGFTSFYDSDPFGTGPFKSSESNASTPKRASDTWSAF